MIKLLPVLLVLLGIGGGVGAGLYLKPALPAEDTALQETDPCGPAEASETQPRRKVVDPATREYVKLNNQFVIPVVRNDRVNALVLVSLSVEIGQGKSQTVFAREPKLRDEFLQVLFNHANMGGFNGEFTKSANMAVLRRNLHTVGMAVLGDDMTDVLITEIARQDV